MRTVLTPSGRVISVSLWGWVKWNVLTAVPGLTAEAVTEEVFPANSELYMRDKIRLTLRIL